ncbi:MAG: hypothetical protein O3A00_09095 [Planctomycetota bacterium]|nr:hypothetical protein [Planctomycetota bacterium]
MRRLCIHLASFLLASASTSTIDAQKLTTGNFDNIRTLILPSAEESGWSSIPWMNDLFAARQRAAREGKPVFVWSMAAEPLGFC